MAYSIITHKGKNNILYTAAYRHLPIFEIGMNVPDLKYYIQFVNNNYQIFDRNTSKIITFGDVMELSEDKIVAIKYTITVLDEIIDNLI